ncbi:MAG: methyl-accepting chemotaxis protein [Bacteroidota bacterium]|nr:methyl-accepting chemotaxis protein [Bacteroidota bacterium]MDP4191473.1 methyl-accepting chemotaxis protein [Bacteroidota bacterium]MDP4195892.1 methyl-accepting chemotaxis protein [Bacteroidota bacterium]
MLLKSISNKFSRIMIKRKILLLVSLFGLIMVGFYTIYSYLNEKSLIQRSIDEKLLSGIYGAYYVIGDQLHDRINDSTSISQEENLENIKKLNVLTKKLGLKYIYSMVEVNGHLYFTSSSATDEDLEKKTYSPFFQEYTEASETLKEAFLGKDAKFEEATDRWGTLRSGFAPFTTPAGKTYLIGADYSMTDIYHELFMSLLKNIFAGILIYIPFFIITQIVLRRIVKPIHQLAETAQKISDGDYSLRIKVNSNDETKILADTLNKMVENVNESLEKLSAEKFGVEKKVEEAVRLSESQTQYLSHSVESMLMAMDRFAGGDLTVRLNIDRDDLIGKMFRGFNETVESFSKMVINVTEAIQETASASNQISASTEEMALGSSQQASEISRIASSIEQMIETILNNTKDSETAAKTASSAGDKAKQGGVTVSDTMNGMNRIAEVVLRSASQVEELGKSSNKIGEIIQVIDDIADQTNLLALNAAIEAARAGEQGRGFAVVADEVRKLAEKTSKATKEIALMIKQIQSDTIVAVESISKGTKEVEHGKSLAGNASQALSEIISGTEIVSEVISRVALASEMQASSSEEISRNIEAITKVTNKSTTEIQQIASAASDLDKLTLNLQQLIGKFNTGIFQRPDIKLKNAPSNIRKIHQ